MLQLPNEKTASNVQKNIIGYALIAMGGAVCTLFVLFISLNSYIREDLQKSNRDMQLIMYKNNQVLQDLKVIFIVNQQTLKAQSKLNHEQQGEIAAQNFIRSLDPPTQ